MDSSNPLFQTKKNWGVMVSHDDLTIRATRALRAPRPLVFDVMTKPEHVRKWYGPNSETMTECTIDLRVGGKFRYVFAAPNGEEFAFSGEYLEVVPPEHVVNTWRFEAISDPNHGTIEEGNLTEANGITTVELIARYRSREDLAGWENSGGEAGMIKTLQNLEDLIEKQTSAVPA